jgi:DNA polymerase/3'-5' exonuclease PolX
MFNRELSEGLESIADHLKDEAKRRAVREAARIIANTHHSVAAAIGESGVEAVHELGINWELSGVVTDWVRSGRLRWLEQLEAREREAVAKLPGIGPKLARELRAQLGICDLPGLADAARDGRLRQAYGFGPKRMKRVADALLNERVSRPPGASRFPHHSHRAPQRPEQGVLF